MAERDDRDGDRPVPPADERAATAYADGYGEGLRDALKDVLQHASRGHTAQELRWLIESRLARVAEEVALKRRALLGPPRTVPWGTLLRPPGPAPAPTLDTTLEGTAVLFREERPDKALAFVGARWRPFGRVVVLGRTADARLPAPEPSVVRIPFAAEGGPDGASPGEVAGKLRGLLSAGPALLLLDSVDFLVREDGIDATLRFLEWLLSQVRSGSSLLVVSIDPATLQEIDYRRFQALFPNVR